MVQYDTQKMYVYLQIIWWMAFWYLGSIKPERKMSDSKSSDLQTNVTSSDSPQKRVRSEHETIDLYMYPYSRCVTLPLPCANAALKLQSKRCRDSSPWTRMNKAFLHGYMAMATSLSAEQHGMHAYHHNLLIHKNVMWLYDYQQCEQQKLVTYIL